MKKKPNLERKKLQNTSLSNRELAVILGGILGNGSLKIHPGEKNARYSFGQGIRQESYFMAKVQILTLLESKKVLFEKVVAKKEEKSRKGCSREQAHRVESPPKGLGQTPFGLSSHKDKGTVGTKTDGLRPLGRASKGQDKPSKNYKFFCTRALKALTEVHSITHPSNKLKVRRKWLNHLSEESLAIWWFDDGSIIGGGRKGFLSTNCSNPKEIAILTAYLKKVWDIDACFSPVFVSKKGKILKYRLYFSTINIQKFLSLIVPYVPCKSVLYKTILNYKDKNLQQRWISHTKKLLPSHLLEDYEKMI